jgi:hypothetical protein
VDRRELAVTEPVEEKGQSPKSTPEHVAVGTPAVQGLADHSALILTTVMELQRSVGGLIHAVETLTGRADEQGKKLESISHRITAAVAVIVVIGAIMGWIVDKSWDVFGELLKQHIH